MPQLNLRLPEDLKKMAEKFAKHHGYKNLQELAKESIRMKIIGIKNENFKPEPRVAVSGKDLLKRLDKETVKAIREIPENEWKKGYLKIKESEKRRLKLLTQASSWKRK